MKESIINWLDNNISLHNELDRKHEIINGATHITGLLLSVIGLIMILLKRSQAGSTYPLSVLILYGISMITLYASSSAYHLAENETIKKILRIADHFSIYFLIAGTYTPYSVLAGGDTGMMLIILIWAIAVSGMTFKIIFWKRFRILHVSVYLAMGWLLVFYWKPFFNNMPADLIPVIAAGGLSYTAGIIFYVFRKIPYNHAIWHLFVLSGSAFYWYGVWKYMI
jgi:hemolysin III